MFFKVLLIFHSESQLKKSRGILLRRNNDTKVAIGKRRLFRGKKHTSSYEVAYYDGDFTGAMKIPALLAVVIKVSEEQTELLGRDAAYVARFGLGWVITNYEIEIHRLPKVGEKVAITTQAMSYNKYFCYRNFWVHDEEGNECVFVKSTFVLMDQKIGKSVVCYQKLLHLLILKNH